MLSLLYCIYFPPLLPTMFIIIRSAHAYFSSFSSVLSAGSCLPLRSSAFPTLCTYVRARLRTFFMFLCTARFSLPKYNWRCDAPVFPSLSTPRPPPPFRPSSDHFLYCNFSPAYPMIPTSTYSGACHTYSKYASQGCTVCGGTLTEN